MEKKENKNKFDYREGILALLHQTGAPKTICLELKQDRVMMEHVRRRARLLVADNIIEITHSGKAVDPLSFKGPIRLRLK